MASAVNNPVRGKANLIARAIYRQMTGSARSNPGARFPKGHGGDLSSIRRSDYDQIRALAKTGVAEWVSQKDLPADQRTGIFSKKAPGERGEALSRAIAGSKDGVNKDLLAAIHSAVASEMKAAYGGKRGFIKRQFGAKGGRYVEPRYRVIVPAKGAIKAHYGRNIPKRQKGESTEDYKARYRASALGVGSARRVSVRGEIADWDASTRTWGHPGYSAEYPKVSGTILKRIGQAGYVSPLAGFEKAGPGGKRRGKKVGAKKGASTQTAALPGQKASTYQSMARDLRDAGVPVAKTDKMATVRSKWLSLHGTVGNPSDVHQLMIQHGARRTGSAAEAYREAHGLGGLALENYGGLALENGLPFVGGVAVSGLKLAGTGLAGVLVHAYAAPKVEELLPRIPVIGDMILDISVPEMIPVIGGMGLSSTIVGGILGGTVIFLSRLAADRLGSPELAMYGMALGVGTIITGPVLDFVNMSSSDEEDLSGLALENMGGLALENMGALAMENGYGDGMAYQLAGVGSEEPDYDQANLSDAHYSGADFDLGEGEALINGKHAFRQRFGHPSLRIATHGGSATGPSHLAGQAGHRWGWMAKMIGWDNIRRLAALPPAERVSVIKQLRENALKTWQSIQAQKSEATAAAPELAPQGAEGAGGVGSLYGATLFAGNGI